MAFEVVDENNVYTCVGHPLKSDISNIVEWMLNDSFHEAYGKVESLKIMKGLSLQVHDSLLINTSQKFSFLNWRHE